MLDLVKYLVSNIVDSQEEVNITETVDETNTHIITIKVAEEDMGKIIGKGGKIINAIRELAKVKAIKKQARVKVQVKDPMKIDQFSRSEPLAPPPYTT